MTTGKQVRKRGPGRPLKYDAFLRILEDDTVYIPATIVRNGESFGLIDSNQPVGELKLKRLRIRHTMARFATNHGFPVEGDGWIILRGQPPLRGWYGWRWKEAMPCG